MVALGDSSAGRGNSASIAGTPLAVTNRLVGLYVPLAKWISIRKWVPAVSDFLIWHGWWRGRWYGVISEVRGPNVMVIKENLPSLLFTLDPAEYEKHGQLISVNKIMNSPPGAFHVLKGDTWYI